MSVSAPALPTPLVQYIVVRTDLSATWPLGAVVAQACHACTAALAAARAAGGAAGAAADAYVAPAALPTMHKVVLGTESAASLAALAARLTERGVPHAVWTEQPENVQTALATAPAAKDALAPHFAGMRLLR